MAEGGGSTDKLVHSFSRGGDVVFDFYCEPCKDLGYNKDASGYCEDCKEYLCSDCYHGHRTPRQMRHHRLMDKDSMPKESPLPTDKLNKLVTTFCDNHLTKPVEYYCKPHSVFVCGKCFVANHRGCAETTTIEDISESLLDSREYRLFLDNVKSLEQTSIDASARAKVRLSRTTSSISEIVRSVRELKDKVVATVEKLEKDIIAEADALLAAEEKSMTGIADAFKNIADTMKVIKKEIDNLQSSRRYSQLYITMENQQNYHASSLAELQITLDKLVNKEWEFEPNVKFLEFVDGARSLGTIRCEEHANETGSDNSAESDSVTSEVRRTTHSANMKTTQEDIQQASAAATGGADSDLEDETFHDAYSKPIRIDATKT